MTRRRILEALRNGEVDLAEARRAVLAQGAPADARSGPDVAVAEHAGAPVADVAEGSLAQLQAELVQSLASALYMEPTDIQLDLNFKDLGLDSIVGVEWVNHLKKQYGIKIPATKVYDHPTILRFADYLAGLLKTSARAPVGPRSSPGAKREIPAAASTLVSRPSTAGASVSVPQDRPVQIAPTKHVHPPGVIAIVGMSGRYPGAPDLSRFWDNLAQGKNSIREIPRERWDVNDYFDADPSKPGKIYCKWLGALDEIDRFDAPFFQISPAEAEGMDPQYRIFLEAAYQAFEDAGYGARSLSNRKCGVYMGVMNSEYVHLLSPAQAQGLNTGNSHSIAAARVSYFLNLKGPAIPIDTACSSSLVATHLACQALRNGEVEMALVGGVTLYLTPASFIGMCAAGMLSPDGQCKSFDNGANGFVPGEGAGALVLKRLEDAERDGDHIHGVIIGSGINQDGRTNGITAPSVQSQIELERDVYQRFGIDPETIDYVETHGTGTKLGDPVELEALTTVFRERTKRRGFCALGSVKSNIGHTSAAAGMAGVQKMLLCFKHRTLVPSLHFREANTHCDFEDSPFYVNTETKPWPARPDAPRRAAVSSMGFSGTNAHLVIEEYPARAPRAAAREPHAIVLSAKNEERLTEALRRLRAFLASARPLPSIRDLAYTLQVGRDGMEERIGLVADSAEDLAKQLGAILDGSPAGGVWRGRVPRAKGKLAFFEPDAALSRDLAGWAKGRDWGKLLECWVTGLVFDWSRIYGENPAFRVSLPTYPFAPERHWVKTDPLRGAGPAAPTTPVETAVCDRGEGVWCLAAGAAAETAPELERLAARSDAKVVVLASKADGGQAAETCALPVVACGGAGDFVVRDGEESALRLAREIAQAPREALVLLKRHLRETDPPDEASDMAWIKTAPAGAFDPGTPKTAPGLSPAVAFETYRDGVVVITLRDTESRNTFSPALARGLAESFERVRRMPECKVVVVTGYGGYFACGGTRDALLAIQKGEAKFTDFNLSSLPLECEVPVIAAMQGHGIGAGWAFGLFCDHAIYAAESIYHSPYLRYGFTPGAGSTLVLPARLGRGLGWEVLFTAREYSGRELAERGLPWPVLPRAEVLPEALRLAHALARSPRAQLVAEKETRAARLRAQLPAVFAREVAMHERTFVGSPEVRARIDREFGAGSPTPTVAPLTKPAGVVLRAPESLRAPAEADLKLPKPKSNVALVPLPTAKPLAPAPVIPSPRTEASPPPPPAVSAAPGGDEEIASIRRQLKESLADALHAKPEEIDEEMPFIELGVDSVICVTWVRGINARHGLAIGATRIYDYPSVAQFAVFLREEMRKLGKFATPPAVAVSAPAAATTPSQTARVPEAAAAREPAPSAPPSAREKVAIIGMAGRFPKARTLAEFWANLEAGRDCISEIPPTRWPIDQFYDPDPAKPGKTCCKWMGALEDIDCFDPLFFQISPAEARAMDPQQRLFIESCWHCIEDAGIDPRRLSGANCGVFVGCGISDYGLRADRGGGVIGTTGVAPSILPGRVSYLLNLKGPCQAIDTSCSSSLVAMANACDSLMLGNCDLAFAGGVLVMSGPSLHIGMSEGGMLSPDGRCFTFDERANGFVPGEGVGVILLKRLSDALRDGDNIHGVIQGWGVNQDGKTNGITAPSMQSQAALERGLHARFGIDPETISLVEAHGTGTRLGDPIEVEALTAAFRASTRKESYCALGSVKSNIGHLGMAAGVAGVLKVLLALRHRTLPPTVNFQRLNPHIPLAGSPFYISERAKAWEATPGRARRACVSSFGFSGTNAHLIIEEAPARLAGREASIESGPALVVLSAKTEDALRETARNLSEFLAHDSSAAECGLHDVAHTLQVGREEMNERLGFIASTKIALRENLEAWLAGREVAGLHRDRVKRNKAFATAFKASEQSRAALEQALRRNDHAELLELWVKGVEIDWLRLPAGRKPRRISLPTYPFAREHYWFAEAPVSEAPTPVAPVESPVRIAQDEVAVDASALFMAYPVWTKLPAMAEPRLPECERHVVLLGRSLCAEEAALRRLFPAAEFVVFESESENTAERFSADARQAFAVLQEVLGQKPAGKALVQAVVLEAEPGASAAGLAALFKTARLENPRVFAQLIEVESGAGVADVLVQAAARPEAAQLRVCDGVWSAPALAEIPWSDATETLPWKDGGVYLITGGAGGLGRIFAGEIAKRSAGATLVWAGRSSLPAEREAALRELEGRGAKVVYRSLDVADAAAVANLVRGIRAEHGRLDGVIHAAGLVRDNFILKKGATEFSAVLAPKVAGVVNLDRATRELPLDFFVLFSSGAGATGNAGQADYAAANAFLDGFARWRSGEVEAGRRFGRTLSLNWPLWRDGGMGVDATTERAMRERTGMAAMESAAGIAAFYRAMATGRPQVMVVAGDVARIRRDLVATSASVDALPLSATTARPEDVSELRGGTLARLKTLLGEIIDLPAGRIEADEPLESYGIDSLMVTRLNQQLARVYPEVSQTLFFEFKTLGEIATHLVTAFPADSVRWTGFERLKPVATSAAAAPVARSELSTSPSRVVVARPDPQEPIAIIGISGRYAQAETLEAFWANLVEGKDCVTEIPPKRWALDGFFEADPETAIRQGKSYSKWGSFLEGFAEFDPLFFNISPLEALGMDPQERLFLQAAWEAVEAAGYTRARLAETVDGNVGVFAGVTKTGFELYREDWRRQGEVVTPYTSFGSIANRVSYVLNLKGPSMPIDTMCSSSLTAIHEACEQLRRGACRMAIAGGVNLYLHPSSYVGLCAQRMLSRDGKCKSFGEGGNGFVPGEGVGVVLLKPLSRARADGDPIHAIIRGTSANHGGKTNGYTVPNPNAQREVIRDALKKSGLDARAVSYVEAHGTGTELGDPIEVTGLAQAFAEDTAETGFCALGSAKSNLGHLEAAAGVAGLTKVVLQLRHGKLAPSLHAETLNPKIPFGKTPFVLQREAAEWRRPTITRDGRTRELPRVAGVSSFGAGGSNAHVIIEEAPEAPATFGVSPSGGPALVVLSAKTEERLRAYAKKLADHLAEASANGEPDLHELAYTLQTGREAMDERLALVVASLAELREKLAAFLTDSTGGATAGLHRARVTRGADGLGELYADEDMVQTVLAWLRKGKFARIADLWVRGAPLDWSKLHGEKPPRRIVLPTYPFASETYWVEIKPVAPSGCARLHPLVWENTSDLAGLRFSSRFSGAEFFVADHVVNGAKVLPGVAYLEMARFAALRALGGASVAQADGVLIRNVIWARPISVDGKGTEVHLRLNDAGEDGLAFYVEASDAGGAALLRSQGYARPGRGENAPVLELERLRAEIAERRLSRAECYAAFAAMGVAYGPRFHGLDEVAVGAGQALARLSLPETLRSSASDYGLHPSLMDAALQACIGLSLLEGKSQNGDAATFVPYALDELEMFGPAVEASWVWIRPCRAENSEARVPKLDLDLCDERGRVKIALRGLSFRRFDGDAVRGDAVGETWLMAPDWTPSSAAANAAPVEYDSHLVLTCGLAPFLAAVLREIGPDVSTVSLRTDGIDEAQCFTGVAVQVFEVVRERLKSSRASTGRQLVQIAIPSGADGQLWGALAGLMKTLRLENPAFVGQVVALDPCEDEISRARKLRECRLRPDETEIRYVAGAREVRVWADLSEAVEPAGLDAPWKNDGVYLITGGAGGIGLIFAEAISKRVRGATVVLCGRSSLSDAKQARLDELSKAGARVVYRRADVARRDEVARLIAEIRADYGRLDGVLHAAGMIRDRLIVNKPADEFREVLAPKVDGAVHLDEATRDLALDFFALFAAGAGVLGNPGQADYATANAFLDGFAQLRNGLVAAGKRSGRTLAVDWPFWADGGMKMDAETIAAMRDKLGLSPLSANAGVAALARAWASGRDQVLVANGERARVRALFARPEATSASPAPVTAPASGGASLEEKTVAYFRELLSTTLRVPLARIHPDGVMSDLGIDSVVVMNLTNRLEEHFGALTKTLFFEHQTIRALARHFVAAHAEKLARLFPAEEPRSEVTRQAVAPLSTPVATRVGGARAWSRASSLTAPARVVPSLVAPADSPAAGVLDIAIIGVSGRYPQARNVDEFWAVLREGRDCITEVPQERWDWRDYYSEDPARPKGHSSKWGGFIDDIDKFDPQFFHISPKIAPYLDPQERLILEETWKALEDAGYRREDLQKRVGNELVAPVGVYIGAMYGEYQLFGAEASLAGRRLGFAGNLASLANRVSYVLNLHGPSMMVDTMCSSSLTCLHLACQDLAAGRTDYGIAGGVNVTVHPNKYLMLSGGQFLSAAGRCESFGEGGAGYIPSEGVGVVVLKRLADAERDGDHIYGVIKASAVNHGGRTHGYSVPNPKAQERVVAQALRDAGLDPRVISYIEAHGTGTKLGDPIEIAGLANAFGKMAPGQRCWVGSAKSNIGHCESAAGIAGLTKVLLQMKHGQIAPSLHSRVLNPHIDFAATPFVVNQSLREWARPVVDGKSAPRIAGISSFGAGGSNAHVIVEEYVAKGAAPAVAERDGGESAGARSAAEPAFIVLSAKTEERLIEVGRGLRRHLDSADCAALAPDVLRSLAYTLQVGREAMEERIGFAVNSLDELKTKLDRFLRNEPASGAWLRGSAMENAGVNEAAHGALLERWVAGAAVEWRSLYGARPPRRVSLPTYPFARKRFWVGSGPVQASAAPAGLGASSVSSAPVALPAADAQPSRGRALAEPSTEARVWGMAPLEKPTHVMLAPLPAARQPMPVSTPEAKIEPKVESEPELRAQAPVAPVAAIAAPDALRKELRLSLAQALFLEENEVGLDKPFFEMGLDSIVGVEWVNAINKKHGLTIPANQVYEYPNLRKFAGFLHSQLSPAEAPAEERPAPAPTMAPVAVPPVVATPAVESARVENRPAAVAPKATPTVKTTDIAIIGMAGRFPGGETLEEFWDLLQSGRNAFTSFPGDRDWDLAGFSPGGVTDPKIAATRGAFLREVDRFDPLFFHISPKEAMTMDPGERLFLQETWKAIEDAGIAPAMLSGRRWGVFCGNGGDYSLRIKEAIGYSPHVTLAQVPSRVSHCLNLTGPSQSNDAGCASALLAIAQACDHLVLGKCEAAIAGGVLVHSTPNLIVSASQVGLLASAEAGGRALDRSAAGMVPGEAVGVVVLKPLADALAAGDRIHGVIEGWASNHNGKTSGLVSPSVDAQAALFTEVYERYKIDPESIGLVEANAAGLPLADAAEVHALTRAFRQKTDRRRFCALGTVENNVGHGFHASGMSHMMKVLLGLRHRRIPGTPGAGDPDPALKLDESPFYVPPETIPWTAGTGRRRAAISSFGATGANVHLVIAEPPGPPAAGAESAHDAAGAVLITLSAKTESGLRQSGRNLAAHLARRETAGERVSLRRLSANLLLRRSHFEHRCAVVVADVAELQRRLREIGEERKADGVLIGVAEPGERLRPALAGLANRTIEALAAGTTDAKARWLVLADLFVQGVSLEPSALFSPNDRAPLNLPGYPFEKRRCWIDAPRRSPGWQGGGAADTVECVAPRGEAETLAVLTGFLAEITGLSPTEIVPASKLSEYGVDSLLGMRLLNRINARFGGGFDASLLVVETIAGVAAEIARRGIARGGATALVDSVDAGSRTWARPGFIETSVVTVGRRDAPDSSGVGVGSDAAPGARTLERLVAQGIGVWREAGSLRFEHLARKEAMAAAANLVDGDEAVALYAFLRAGERCFPVTDMQRFALQESEVHGRTSFNLCQGFRIDMPVDASALNDALNDLARRHSIFRTGARLVGRQWMQVVRDESPIRCREVVWPEIGTREEFSAELARFQRARNTERFDATRPTLFDVYLLHNETEFGAVVFHAHHFHADGFTLYLFQQELHERYLARKQGRSYAESARRAEYAHFALSQFAPERAEVARHWLDKLRGKRAAFALRDREALPAGALAARGAGVCELSISTEFLSEFEAFNRRQGTTLTQIVTCALAVLLRRLTGENHPIQMVYNLRDRAEFESVLGDFSASVPMLLELDEAASWSEVFRAYESAMLDIQRHKHFDFSVLLQAAGGDAGGLWGDVALDSNDRDAFGEVSEFAGRLIDIAMEDRPPVAPLLVCVVKTGGKMTVPLLYDRARFSARSVELLAENLRLILGQMTREPGRTVRDAGVLRELAERLEGMRLGDPENAIRGGLARISSA